MQVRAISKGFYGQMRMPGDVFECHREVDLGSWMQPVDPADTERLKGKMAAVYKGRMGHHPVPGARPTTGPGYEGSLANPLGPEPDPPAKP